MEPVKIYQTAWRGLGSRLIDLEMGWRDYARCEGDCCPGTELWNYMRGGKDAYKEAFLFVKDRVMTLPYEEQAQALEAYCQQLCVDPENCQDNYSKKRVEESKSVVYCLSQDIVALRERFGNGSTERGINTTEVL